MNASEENLKDATALVKQMETPYLQQLQTVIQAEMKLREKSAITDSIVEIQKIAGKLGMTVEQLMSISRKAKAKATVPAPVKFRHPDDPSLHWSGRGNSPQWVTAWKAQHGNLDGCTV